MAGTCNSVRCLPTSALSRAEVTGDFGGSLMRQSSKVRSTRRCDCGDYQAAAWTTCSAWTIELDRCGSVGVRYSPIATKFLSAAELSDVSLSEVGAPAINLAPSD